MNYAIYVNTNGNMPFVLKREACFCWNNEGKENYVEILNLNKYIFGFRCFEYGNRDRPGYGDISRLIYDNE